MTDRFDEAAKKIADRYATKDTPKWHWLRDDVAAALRANAKDAFNRGFHRTAHKIAGYEEGYEVGLAESQRPRGGELPDVDTETPLPVERQMPSEDEVDAFTKALVKKAGVEGDREYDGIMRAGLIMGALKAVDFVRTRLESNGEGEK